MKRQSVQCFLWLMVFSLLFTVSSTAFDLQSTLQKHDPKVQAADTKVEPNSPTPATNTAGTTGEKGLEKIASFLDQLIKALGELISALGAPNNGTNTASNTTATKKVSKEYTVVSGDNLRKIARKYLGDPSRYWDIVNANKDRYPSLAKNPNLIQPGWKLRIPGFGGSSTGTGGGNSAPASNTPPSEIAKKVAQVAASFPGRYGPHQFPYHPDTQNGNLGCANVVSAALREAGVPIAGSLAVDGVARQLQALKSPNSWKKTKAPPYKEGDVVIWAKRGKHGHIGIVAKNGNSLQAMNNSSARKKPSWGSIEYRAIAYILRKS